MLYMKVSIPKAGIQIKVPLLIVLWIVMLRIQDTFYLSSENFEWLQQTAMVLFIRLLFPL